MQRSKKIILSAAVAACFASNPYWISTSQAAELNTNIPKSDEEIVLGQKITVNLPAQPLAASLKALSAKIGLNITYNDKLVSDKQAPALSGSMRSKEALQKLLANTGLQAKLNDQTLYIQRIPATSQDKSVQLDKVEVRAKRFYEIGPLPGLGLTKEQIPGNVQSISAQEIKEAHSLSITELMNRKLQSVNVNDYAGNPFQMDVTYRGFTAGPQIGTPQGLSVFFDGIRVNEPFGDVVNWDMIPMNALASVDVFPGSNPIFGLNTLGGAFTLKTKDGFNNAGFDADVLTGSFGRKQLQTEVGWNNGTIGLFAAGNFFMEDGWRVNSPSKVNQVFGKASYRGEKLDLNLSTLLVKTELTGNGLLPSEEYARDRNSVFTSPDTTDNTLGQFQLSGSYFMSDTFTVTAQVYRRNSKRHQVGADVFTDYRDGLLTQPKSLGAGQRTCLYASTGPNKGVPDYFVIPLPADANGFADTYSSAFYTDYSNNYFSDPAHPGGRSYIDPVAYAAFKNAPIPEEFATNIRQYISFGKNQPESTRYNRDVVQPPTNGPGFVDGNGNPVFDAGGLPLGSYSTSDFFLESLPVDLSGSNILSTTIDQIYFYSIAGTNSFTTDGIQIPQGTLIKNLVVLQTATNNDECAAGKAAIDQYIANQNGNVFVDGKDAGIDPTGKGFGGIVDGTPTAIFNDNNIKQVIDGASIQFNLNLEKHKFMVGASIDAAKADYSNKSQLGFFTIDREAYLDPAQAHPMFSGASQALSNNDFSGTNTTKSIYFSETWMPVETLSLTASARYNETTTENKVAARYGFANYSIGDAINSADGYNVCDGDCTTNRPPTYIRPPNFSNPLNKPETEKFSFYSFNPSLGGTWQAMENLNLFANWAQGTRTPSVIELGCAFDKTPVLSRTADTDFDGIPDQFFYQPKSIVENRQCTLPTALSGDPYLPQIKANTYDLGMRGNFKSLLGTENLKWNLGAYQTDLKDDIYFVTLPTGAGFFDTIGKTRRRGLEAGISGTKDKWGFNLNYSLTEATFQDDFLILSADNSSSFFLNGYGNVTQVKKGSRMPGVPLNNLNASISYEVTPEWRIGLSAVMHSESFVRGNENNEHQKGALVPGRDNLGAVGNARLQPARNPGTVPGYAVFNLQTSYRFNKEWTATMLVNNLFDTEYYTAGRLGRNPFSPSIFGAIGPDGYNHNSGDWRSTNFISPAAPRGVWFSLNWHFVPD